MNSISNKCNSTNVPCPEIERQSSSTRPMVYRLYETREGGDEIEGLSLKTIDLARDGFKGDSRQWEVVRRMIHASADFSIAKNAWFSPNAINAAIGALRRGCSIYVDSNMIRSGLSLMRLSKVNPCYGTGSESESGLGMIRCHVADADVAREANQERLPRSLFAVRKAVSILNGGIAVIGNAPVALLELNRMIIEKQVMPALIIGMPVGFVHVNESKEELMSLDVPAIVLRGARGGSAMAVSALHALCIIAQRELG